MKIAIIGDTHFGFQWGTERSIDSFLQASDALEKACSKDVDLILQVGDFFDTRVPKPEIVSGAMKVLIKPLLCKSSNVRIINTINKSMNELSNRSMHGIPLVAIHGTHDRRSRGLINPVESMEQAGFLIHLNRGSIIFEKEGERVAIHGFSGVPERFAGENFTNWNPEVIPDIPNIMLLHQSFSEYIYSPLEPPTMNTEILPVGFDLFVNGHIHWSDVKDLQNKGMFLLSGSTIVTQITKADIERPKYVWFYDTKTKKLTKEEVKQVRKMFLKEINVTNLSSREIKELISNFMDTIPKESEKALVKIKLIGKLSKEVLSNEITDVTEFLPFYLVTIEKRFDNEINIEKIRSLHESLGKRLSSEEVGVRMLHEELEGNIDFDIESLFKLLSEDNIEDALNQLKNSGDAPTKVKL